VTEEVLDNVGKEARDRLLFFCKMEQNRSFALNDDDEIEKSKRLQGEIIKSLSIGNGDFDESFIIAAVFTYFDIASKRLIEAVPVICRCAFAQSIGERLQKDLVAELGLIGDSGLQTWAKFAQEEPARRDQKQWLLRSKIIVEKSLRLLDIARS